LLTWIILAPFLVYFFSDRNGSRPVSENLEVFRFTYWPPLLWSDTCLQLLGRRDNLYVISLNGWMSKEACLDEPVGPNTHVLQLGFSCPDRIPEFLFFLTLKGLNLGFVVESKLKESDLSLRGILDLS